MGDVFWSIDWLTTSILEDIVLEYLAFNIIKNIAVNRLVGAKDMQEMIAIIIFTARETIFPKTPFLRSFCNVVKLRIVIVAEIITRIIEGIIPNKIKTPI